MNFKKIKDKERSRKVIKVEVDENNTSLEKLLEAVRDKGNTGHSFKIVVDPDQEPVEIGWDGDGQDRIFNIS